ncbi:MAG: glycosyltransferase [Planctomycetales bacterium]|nr:glycosyltransferase [Planctomycetales bacterium]
MRVLVFEPNYVGHNLAYVRHLMHGLGKLNCDPHFVTSVQSRESTEYQAQLGDLTDSFQTHAFEGFSSRANRNGIRVNGFYGARAILHVLNEAIVRIKPHHLYIPFGNPVANLLAYTNGVTNLIRRNNIETEIILLFGRYSIPQSSFLGRWKRHFSLSLLHRGPWFRIHHILPFAVSTIQSFDPQLAAKTRLLPDPVTAPAPMSHQGACQKLGIPADGKYISLLGVLEERKGIYQLLTAFERALPELAARDRLLLAGRPCPQVALRLGTSWSHLLQSGRVVLIDRYLDNEEMDAALRASATIATPYPRHQYSASIVIRAAASQVPVIANSIGWMRDVVQRHQLGKSCETNNPEVFSQAIIESFRHSGKPNPSAQRFAEFHSVPNFVAHITDRLSRRLKEPSLPSMSWQALLESTEIVPSPQHCPEKEKAVAA